MNVVDEYEDENDNGYIDNNKVYLKLKIGWKTSSIFTRLNVFSNYQSNYMKFSIFSMIISEMQYFFFIYNSSLIPHIKASFSDLFQIVVLKFNNPIYDIAFISTLLLCSIFLFICIFFDFLKPKDSLIEFPKKLEMVGALISQCIYGIFAFPVLFSLFNFLECNKNNQETEYFLKCFSSFHIILSLFSIFNFIITAIYSYVQYIFIMDFNPTKSNKVTISKYTGKEDYIEFIGKFILVLNKYARVYYNKKSIEIGITTVILLFIAWRQLFKQPFYSNQCNNFKNIIKTGLLFASFISFLLEVLKINKNIISFYLIIGVNIFFSIAGFYLGKYIRNSKKNNIYKNLKIKYNNFENKREAYFHTNDTYNDDASYYSLDRIVNESYVIKKDYVFNDINDCIFACDFIKHNHELNSFLLAAKILDECTIQYKKNPMSYIYFWLYLNTMIMAMKNNIELYKYEDCIKQIELFERIQNNILKKVIKLGNTYYTKYLIYIILIIRTNNIKDDESEDENKGKNLNFHENELKNHTINLHFLILNELSNAFKNLKSINSKDDVYKSINNILSLTKRINETEASYKAYIKTCYMSSDSLLLYNLFLENIMIDYYAASYYMKLIEENKEKRKQKSVNRLSIMRQSRGKILSESAENLELNKRKEDLIAVKKEKKKQNEAKERTLERLQKPVHKFAFLLRVLSIVEYLVMSIGYFYYKYTYSDLINKLDYIYVISEGPHLMNSITKDIKYLSFSCLAENEDLFNNTFSNLEKSKIYIDEKYLPLTFEVGTIDIATNNIYNPLTEDLYDDISHQSYFQVTSDIQKNLNVILDKEYLYNQTNLLHNPYFKYFSENSKGSHEKVYLSSLDHIQQIITNIFDYQLIYVLLIMSVSVFIITLMILKGFIPILNKISKFKFCVVQLFRDISVEHVNKIIKFHESQSQYYMKNYSTIIKNNPEDNENIEVKKNVFRDNSKIDLFTFIIVTIITAIFMILPLSTIFLIRNHSLGELELIFVSTKRTYYSQAIQTWAHELFYMDSETYRRGEPSAFILEAVNTLESLEKSINKGTYGGKSVDKYQILKPLTQNNGCIRGTGDESTCDSRVYDENYTEQIANSPLDVIISEYIIKTRDFISSFTNNYQEVQYTKEDAQKRLEKLNSNSYIIFHNKIIQEINGHVKKMNEVLVADIINNINTTIKLVDFLHVVSMIFIPLIYFYYFRNFAKRKLREMETLTIVFSNIPRSVCEKSTKIKLFIRHGTLESTF